VNAQKAELEQTRQLLASSVARLYWEWQTQAAAGRFSRRSNMSRTILSVPIASCISTGSPPPWRGGNDINASKTEEQLAEVNGKMKAVEARLVALTNSSSVTLTRHALPTVTPRYRRRSVMNCWHAVRIFRRRTGISKPP
jgi:outer membrane protein TolC